ncbi:MAG TPA: alkene reductase [Balneolales bacterium]|nr:alkene reductase [Balneolales bacterium]
MALDLLLSEYQLGSLTLKNRVVMAPMTRSRALKNIPNEMMAEYYRQRASAGLIIAEGTPPSPHGSGYPRIPGIYNEEQVTGWKTVTNAVHERNGHIFLQIMHTGRVGHLLNLPDGAHLVAPSAIPVNGKIFTSKGMIEMSTPKELTTGEVTDVIEDFVKGAENAMEANFDGIELHGANGYIIEQFLNPNTNHRNDQYGGNLKNRSRFVLEIAEKVSKAIGKDKVGIRFSPYGTNNDMPAYSDDEVEKTYAYLSEKLNEIGIAYIHISRPVDKTIQNIRSNFDNTIIQCGGLTASKAEKLLQDGTVDLTAFGRPYLANPDLVERFKSDAVLNEPDPATFYSPGEKGYIDYPMLEEV